MNRDSKQNISDPHNEKNVSPAADLGRPPAVLVADLRPLEIVAGRYKVASLVGRGAAGNVYAVEQILIKKRFALKMLNSNAASAKSKKRFQNEALAASKLDHPNLVRAVDFGIHDNGCLFMVMDFVEGKTLSQYLKQVGRLSVEEALNIFIPICFALEYAHEQGVIHRDLKPSNIILDDSDLNLVPKIVDFGIAKLAEEVDAEALTKTGEVFGTPLYMSPEQCTGVKVDRRSDIYSLGCVMYEALTGTPPFCGQSALETMMQHSTQAIPSMAEASLGTEFPEALEIIIARMLAKEPADRYQRCFTLADHLMHLQRGETVGSLPRLSSPSSNVAAKFLLPRMIVVYALLVLILAAIVFQILRPQARENPGVTKGADNNSSPAGKVADRDSPAAEVGEDSTVSFGGNADTIAQLELPHFKAGDWNSKRIFHFGTQPKDLTYTYGSAIIYRKSSPNGTIKNQRFWAQGDVEIPPRVDIEFDASLLMTMYRPYLFRSFQPDDIHILKFNFGDLVQEREIDTGCFNAGMSYVSGLKGLHRVCFYNVPLESDGLANLRLNDMAHLDYLSIEHTHVDGKDLSHLAVLGQLSTLEYDDGSNLSTLIQSLSTRWRAGDAHLKVPVKRNLMLRRNGLTDNDLLAITNIKLSGLDIRENPAVTESGLKHLVKLKGLEDLTLTGQRYDPTFLQQLAAQMHLSKLDLSHVSWTNSQREQLRRNLAPCKVFILDPESKMDYGD